MPYGGSVTIRIGLALVEHSANILRAGRIAAQHAVLPAEPQGADAGHWILGNRRRGVRPLLIGDRQQGIDFTRVEARQAQVEIRGVQLLQFEGEERFIPVRPRDRPIYHQPEGLHLGVRPLIAENHWNLAGIAAGPGLQFARGLQAEVSIHDSPVAAGEHGDLEAELADAAAHAIDGGIVFPRVARVKDEPIDRPELNFERLRRCHSFGKHASPHLVEESSEGCARGAGPAN